MYKLDTSCIIPLQYLLQQPIGFPLDGANVGGDLRQGAELNGLIEIFGEGKLIACLFRAGFDVYEAMSDIAKSIRNE